MDTSLALQFVSILIAINALVTVFFLWIINKDKKKLEKNVKRLTYHIEYTESMVDSLSEWIISQERKERIEHGWIYEMIANNQGMQACQTKRIIMQDINNELKIRKQELMLHSNDNIRRDSAFKQLANGYGDIDSYILMKKIVFWKSLETKKHNYFIKSFKKRLKEE